MRGSKQRPLSLRDFEVVHALRDMDRSIVQKIAEKAVGLEIEAGTEIISHLDQSTDVFYLLEGELRAVITAASGRQVTYQVLKAGFLVGEISAIDNERRSLTNYAETDVFVARLTQREFIELIRTEPDYAITILQSLAATARSMSEQVFKYHTYDVKGRVVAELLRQCVWAESETISITDRDMASRVGTTRENVTRIYRRLKDDGVIERNTHSIRILDADQLEDYLEDSEFG